ncbi:glutathione S-transferase-like [Oppia nitens]|uniref:glutathione S-transferase-like n=1 Tax=Oppia nitens TaxID=1686743 RepID=UPI0023DA0E4B|nr:glutathione S-transferase-like [Oppia nitens]
MAPVLGYWNIHGRAQPIRLMLAYTGTDYEDKRYTSASDWSNDKHTLGLDFPNLPYYLDDDDGVKLTQSVTIMRFIGRINNLDGQSPEERVRIALVEQQLVDYIAALTKLCYDPEFANLKDNYIGNQLAQQLQLLDKFLGNDRPFLAGDNMSYVDFIAFNYIDKVSKLAGNSVIDEYDNLKNYFARILEFPSIENYRENEPKVPFLGRSAQWGNTVDI